MKSKPTMKEILNRVEKKRGELPKIVQVVPHDWDTIVLADTIHALRPYLKHLWNCQVFSKPRSKRSDNDKNCNCGLVQLDLGD